MTAAPRRFGRASGDESLLIITRGGMVVRTPVDQVSQQGRSTQGVTVMRMAGDDEVIQVAVLPAGDEVGPGTSEDEQGGGASGAETS